MPRWCSASHKRSRPPYHPPLDLPFDPIPGRGNAHVPTLEAAMTQKHVPTLDIRRYDTDRDAFVRDIGAA